MFCYFRLLFLVWPGVNWLIFLHKYQNLHSVFFDRISVGFHIDESPFDSNMFFCTFCIQVSVDCGSVSSEV